MSSFTDLLIALRSSASGDPANHFHPFPRASHLLTLLGFICSKFSLTDLNFCSSNGYDRFLESAIFSKYLKLNSSLVTLMRCTILVYPSIILPLPWEEIAIGFLSRLWIWKDARTRGILEKKKGLGKMIILFFSCLHFLCWFCAGFDVSRFLL